MKGLTKQELTFAKEVAIDGNATRAVKKAFKGINISPGGISVKASRLIKQDKVIKAIEKAKMSLADAIPDKLVIEKHKALLNKTEKKFNSEGELISEDIDANAVKSGVDMAYKLKGAYNEDNQKSINLLMPVLVKFLNIKDEGDNNRDTK